MLVAKSYLSLKNAFAANVVGAPVTAVAPFDPIVSVVTDCVQLTRTSCLSTALDAAGNVIVPAAYPATGVRMRCTFSSPSSPALIATVNPVAEGAAYWVVYSGRYNVDVNVRLACIYASSSVIEAFLASPLFVENKGRRSPPCIVLAVDSSFMVDIVPPNKVPVFHPAQRLLGLSEDSGTDCC